jgi:hypothetical protein
VPASKTTGFLEAVPLQDFCTSSHLLSLRMIKYHSRLARLVPPAADQNAHLSGRTSLNCDRSHCRTTARVALTLVCLMSMAATVSAQESTAAIGKKWRPKDGTYVGPGHNYNRCGDFGDVIVELADKSISGSEWSCKVTRLTDTAPGAIRLDMTCNDYNLALFINDHDPNAYERKFKEVMLLRKIDGKSMFVRKTQNGKFKDPDWQADYCSEEDQRAYTEATARNKAEAERKIVEERLRLSPWRPRDGIYATPGSNFEDRCQASDTIIEFTERSISSGPDKCSITFIRDEPDVIQLFATCSPEPNAQGASGPTPAPRSSETMVLKKIDDKTVFLQKSTNGTFIDPGKSLSYCGQEVQRMHAQRKPKK